MVYFVIGVGKVVFGVIDFIGLYKFVFCCDMVEIY